MESKKHKRVVVKIGSNVLTRTNGELDVERMASLVEQIAKLHRSGMEVIIVSSGAVASGRSELKGKQLGKKLDPVSARQLYSSVGQAKLINRYYELFKEHSIVCGQILTMKENFSTRGHYLNQKNCMTVMLDNGVIPIVNENDAVAVTELMFTDNDELSGLISAMMDAEELVILSNVDGIYNGDPKEKNVEVIREIKPQAKDDVSKYIKTAKSDFGRGGMLTKYRIAHSAAGEGIAVTVANGKKDNILVDVLGKKSGVVSTRFVPAGRKPSGVKTWIAHSGDFAKGELHVNNGAYEALTGGKARSLLPVGVERIGGTFEKDDIVRIISPAGKQIGVGKAAYGSMRAKELLGNKGAKPIVHYDYLHLENNNKDK